MADPKPDNDIQRSPEQLNNTRDPEFEIPDPEQVQRDIEEAERLYKKDDKQKPAA